MDCKLQGTFSFEDQKIITPFCRLHLHSSDLVAFAKTLSQEWVDVNQSEMRSLYAIETLKKHGLLSFRTAFVECTPFSERFKLVEQFSASTFSLSRFALVRLHERKWVVETPLGHARIEILTPEGWALLHALQKRVSLKELQTLFPDDLKELQDTLCLFFSTHLLDLQEESSKLSLWEHHDLYFHSRSRIGRHDAPFGGLFPFRGKIPPPIAFKECEETLLPLSKPKEALSLSLGETLERRTSIREHGQEPIPASKLGAFLYHAARCTKQFSSADENFGSRLYPGGGARYELEIYPIVHQCRDLDPAVYHYHPREHALCKKAPLGETAERLLRDASGATRKEEFPQLLFVITARFSRVSWKYRSMAYALILKNTGVLIQTFYLIATALELAPCAVGAGHSDLFSDLIDVDPTEEAGVGEFMLGSKPSATPM